MAKLPFHPHPYSVPCDSRCASGDVPPEESAPFSGALTMDALDRIKAGIDALAWPKLDITVGSLRRASAFLEGAGVKQSPGQTPVPGYLFSGFPIRVSDAVPEDTMVMLVRHKGKPMEVRIIKLDGNGAHHACGAGEAEALMPTATIHLATEDAPGTACGPARPEHVTTLHGYTHVTCAHCRRSVLGRIHLDSSGNLRTAAVPW